MKLDFLCNAVARPLGVVAKYVQFCTVGLSGLVVDMGVIFLLTSPVCLGWNLTVGKLIAAEFAVLNNFVWNELWTFRGMGESGWRGRVVRFAKFNLVCTAGIVLSVVLLKLQVFWLGINLYLANFMSIVLVSVWNFGLNLKYGWNCKMTSKAHEARLAVKANASNPGAP